MLEKGMTKLEIEKDIENKGDFVKIDHLTRFVRGDVPLETRKFCYKRLAEIYEKRNMFNDAAKCWDNIALISISYNDKIQAFVNETKLSIKAGFFDRADEAMKKAMGEGTANQKAEVRLTIKNFYKEQALVFEKENRRSNAVKIYEKLVGMNLTEDEKYEVKEKLLDLYEKLGKIREYQMLKGKF